MRRGAHTATVSASGVNRHWVRIANYYKRNVATLVARRLVPIQLERALISFTFDDFPRSALLTGGEILNRYQLRGTYYTALGLVGTQGPSGPLCRIDDLKAAIDAGHELGSHTYAHCHSWNTPRYLYVRSIIENQLELSRLFPGIEFRSFSYPISEPRPLTKRAVAKYFLCCRGGGQKTNAGTADLNQLVSFFLERSRDNIERVRDMIEFNHRKRGWLIFSTHDVAVNPSPYGCSPTFFDEVVHFAVNSGALVLPVTSALEVVRSMAASQRNSVGIHPTSATRYQ